jgi:hypothetical protein
MEIIIHTHKNIKIAEVSSADLLIRNPQDALDLMAEAGYLGAGSIILLEKHLDPSFFDLKSGLAGEILQKFSNYNLKLALVGDFSKYNSKSLQDFIRESNRGNRIFFFDDFEAAIARLAGNNISK